MVAVGTSVGDPTTRDTHVYQGLGRGGEGSPFGNGDGRHRPGGLLWDFGMCLCKTTNKWGHRRGTFPWDDTPTPSDKSPPRLHKKRIFPLWCGCRLSDSSNPWENKVCRLIYGVSGLRSHPQFLGLWTESKSVRDRNTGREPTDLADILLSQHNSNK